jgi:hypothetical protein
MSQGFSQLDHYLEHINRVNELVDLDIQVADTELDGEAAAPVLHLLPRRQSVHISRLILRPEHLISERLTGSSNDVVVTAWNRVHDDLPRAPVK